MSGKAEIRRAEDIAHQLLGASFDTLDQRAQKVARHVAQRQHIARNLADDLDGARAPRGARAADAVARFGGSWTFVGLFAAAMVLWVALNGALLLASQDAFDPYPYILLNLFLSMLAAIQAPIILMSQNRQSARDRVTAEHDYEVNLKAELEIMLLHEKIDTLQQSQWTALLAMQSEQLKRLATLTDQRMQQGPSAPERAIANATHLRATQ